MPAELDISKRIPVPSIVEHNHAGTDTPAPELPTTEIILADLGEHAQRVISSEIAGIKLRGVVADLRKTERETTHQGLNPSETSGTNR